MLNTKDSYVAIRNTVGVYNRDGEVMRISGLHRGRVLSWILAKQTEFTEPGTVIESVILDRSGAVEGIALVVMDEESILVISESATSLLQVASEAIIELELEETVVEQSVEFSRAVAVEGPLSWRVVDGIAEGEISEILLNEWRSGTMAGESCVLIRIGTTAEYGYVILTSADSAAKVTESLISRANELGGGLLDPDVLMRARAEVNHPVLPAQAKGLSLFEAGIQWMATPNRDDSYRGSDSINMSVPLRKVVAAISPDSDFPNVGESVFDGEIAIGVVQISTSRAGQHSGFGLLLLDVPYCVPSLELIASGRVLRTVSRPSVDPVSWTHQIGG